MAHSDTAEADFVPPYYSLVQTVGDRVRFRNFDDRNTFAEYASYVESADSRNFVIDFGVKEAWAAFNIGQREMDGLLRSKRPATLSTRWINIWAPELQTDLVKSIAVHYDFSPRLLGLMCSEPLRPLPIPTNQYRSRNYGFRYFHRGKEEEEKEEKEEKSMTDYVLDLEGRMSSTEQPLTRHTDRLLDLNHYRLVDEVWHFSSVDWGPNFLCIGYNSLYNSRANLSSVWKCGDECQNLPTGKRVWTWLILCGDGTIISIHENPFPGQHGVLEPEQQHALTVIRRNLLNVFSQLSKATDGQKEPNPIMTLAIRGGIVSGNDGVKDSFDAPLGDASSLLFYYLFDDWYTSYSLVARKEHQYGAQLEHLRKQMFEKAELGHIERLHGIGRQLAVLKRIYQSYDLIIARVLERQKPLKRSASELGEATVAHPEDDEVPGASTAPIQASTGDILNNRYLGVALSPPTVVRFERLKDRINLYALGEIQDCLDEKESLGFLNFNLISNKQSQAVERLSRITILLAKLTILFLPVSLMTGYFSIQVQDLQGVYTHQTYWASFGVIMAISLIFLTAFGYLSGTVEGKTIYRSLTQTFVDFSKGALGKRKSKAQ